MCPESRAPSLTCKRQSVTGGMGGSHKVTRETELVAELLSGKVSGRSTEWQPVQWGQWGGSAQG